MWNSRRVFQHVILIHAGYIIAIRNHRGLPNTKYNNIPFAMRATGHYTRRYVNKIMLYTNNLANLGFTI